MKKINNLKINRKVLKKATPYVLVAGISFAGFTALHESPFKRELVKTPELTKIEYDSDGYERKSKSYEKKDSENSNKATYKGVWQKDNDGKYRRTIVEYDLKDNVSEDSVKKIVTSDNASYDLDMISKDKETYKEEKDELTENDQKIKPYVTATLYEENEANYIMKEESKRRLASKLGAFILLNISVDYFIFYEQEESKKYVKKNKDK